MPTARRSNLLHNMVKPCEQLSDLSADFDESFNTLFDELEKMPKEARAKAFNVISQTPWFKRAEDQEDEVPSV